MYTYNCNTTGWGTSVTIGFNAAGQTYVNHDPSSQDIACLNSPGSVWNNVIYQLSMEPDIPLEPCKYFN